MDMGRKGIVYETMTGMVYHGGSMLLWMFEMAGRLEDGSYSERHNGHCIARDGEVPLARKLEKRYNCTTGLIEVQVSFRSKLESVCRHRSREVKLLGSDWRLTTSVLPSKRPKLGAVNRSKKLFSSISLQPPPSIASPIHPQAISTSTVNTVSMVAIARSFGAARVAARGFSNAGTLRARSRCNRTY
jgi:hypothetical protein